MKFPNVYDDAERAAAYATLDFPGTYYLGFRDLPGIIAEHVRGRRALDFGCGAGRSTRFLRQLGFEVTGIDISPSMIAQARAIDPAGDYRLIPDAGFNDVAKERFDLVLAAFPFDNIAELSRRRAIVRGLAALLADSGRFIVLGARPEAYTHEWASFTTREFPENRTGTSGDTVRVVMKDVTDARPVLDVLWHHDDYIALYADAGLELLALHTPIGREDEPFEWVSETTVAPWFIHVVGWQAEEGRQRVIADR